MGDCPSLSPSLKRMIRRDPRGSFPHPNVTSDLAPKIQRADHRQGGGGASRNCHHGSNSFVVKILTSNPLALKILQSIFANPAPVAAFRRWEEGGTSEASDFSQKRTRRKTGRQHFSPEFFCRFLGYN